MRLIHLHFVLVPLFLYLLFSTLGALSFLDLYARPYPENPKSVEYKGQVYADRWDVAFVKAEEERDKYYPWARIAPLPLLLGLLGVVAGYAGGLVRDLFDARKTKKIEGRNAFFGLLFGPVVLALICLFPAIAVEGNWRFNIGPLVAFVLISNLFSEVTMTWLKKKLGKILP